MKEIRLLWFDMNAPGVHNYGMWRHPRNRSSDYASVDYWLNLAKELERGRFDALFLADVVGTYDVYGGGPDAALQHTVQVPVNDPMLLLAAIAQGTEHLGLATTVNVSTELPYIFARRMSTLDHLTKGRASWNIVTGYLDSGARAIGQTRQISHDERYDIADNFMDAVYKLWEGSWQDDAVVRDAARNIYTDPSRVHRVAHEGAHYSTNAIHLCEPSPQRTPLLFQAGSSGRGLRFAGRHAECVFVTGATPEAVAPVVASVRAATAGGGRAADDVKIFTAMTVVAAPTDEEARAKFSDYRSYSDPTGALTWASGITGMDLSVFGLDEVVDFKRVSGRGVAGAVKLLSGGSEETTTLRALGDGASIGATGPVVVGSPGTIADEMERWMTITGVDGFNMMRTVAPECLTDFVDLVVPELQRRGFYKKDYASGALRHKIFGKGDRLVGDHYGAQFSVKNRK